MATTDTSGLRERKKQRTREAIVESALRLFEERGFTATTIADIAAAADISPRTFFGYFPTKEDVLFKDADEAFRAFETALEEPRDRHRTALDVLREWIHQWFTAHPVDCDREHLVHSLKTEVPSIEAYERRLMARFEDAMSTAVAADLELASDDVRARMVAAAAVASLKAMEPPSKDGASSDQKPDFSDAAALAVLDDALTFLGAGMAALRPSAPPPPARR